MRYIDNFNGKYNSIGRILDCGSKGYRFKSYYLPMFFRYLFLCCERSKNVILDKERSFYISLIWLKKFYLLQDLLLQEGFLFDFLQKTLTDVFIKKWLILSTYLFNERFLTDCLLKSFIQFVIVQSTLYALIEVFSLKNLLYFMLYAFRGIILFFLFVAYYYILLGLYF